MIDSGCTMIFLLKKCHCLILTVLYSMAREFSNRADLLVLQVLILSDKVAFIFRWCKRIGVMTSENGNRLVTLAIHVCEP